MQRLPSEVQISRHELAPVPLTGETSLSGEVFDATVWVRVVHAPRADATDPDATVIRPRSAAASAMRPPGRGRLLTSALCAMSVSFAATVGIGGLLVRPWIGEGPQEGPLPAPIVEVHADPVPVVFDFGSLKEELQRARAALPVTSGFGLRQHPVSKTPKHHAGVDLDLPRGERISAGSAGTVTFAGWRGGYGRLVEVDHGEGVTTRYAHCDTISVKVGDALEVGTPIGTVGSTGRVTGPHLHFEVRLNDRAVDPEAERWLELYPFVGDRWTDEQLAKRLRPAL